MNDKKLDKKVIFITGGSRGIGLEIVKRFLESGARVYFTYLNSKKAYFEKLDMFKNKNLIPIKCDMRNINEIKKIKKILNKEKKIDTLVNNVGDVIRRSSFIKSDDKLWKGAIDLNLLAAVRTTRILLSLIKNSKDSTIINISSVAARVGGSGDSLHYGVAKGGLNIFTAGLARELRRHKYNTRVVGVAPSIVDTDFQKRHSSKRRVNRILDATPIRRMATPEEISKMVFFLVSSQASYISGETIYITGGR